MVNLKSKSVNSEKELQTIIEQNLFEIFEMHFLATEYLTTSGGRIDSLAVDNKGSPVIIEYKRNQNHNVINQSLSYLKWLKSQKKEFFEMLMQRKLKPQIAKNPKLDWNNPRVVCIAESFSRFDIDTVEVVSTRIELFKYQFYEDNLLVVGQVNIEESAKEKKTASPNNQPEPIIEKHLEKGNDEIKEIFAELRSRIIEMDNDIEERITSMYIAYRLSKSFSEVHIRAKKLIIYLRPIEYQSSTLKVHKIPDGYNWTMNRRIYIDKLSEIDELVKLIEESYNDVK